MVGMILDTSVAVARYRYVQEWYALSQMTSLCCHCDGMAWALHYYESLWIFRCVGRCFCLCLKMFKPLSLDQDQVMKLTMSLYK